MAEVPEKPEALRQFKPGEFQHFWPSLLRAVETEPREDLTALRGISGVEHRFVAAGLDEPRKRLVVISKEARASSVALAQGDLQAALGNRGLQVIVARPVVVDLAAIGRTAEAATGSPVLTGRDLATMGAENDESKAKLLELFGPLVQQITTAMSVGSIDFAQGLMQAAEQIPKLKWAEVSEADPDAPVLDLSALVQTPLGPDDADMGVCPIPLVEFTGDELEVVNSGTDTDAIQAVLRERSVFQYFFPPPDETALAVVNRGISSPEEIAEVIQTSPEIGHPFGEPTITPKGTDLADLVAVLHDQNLLVDAQVTGVELSSLGDNAMVNLNVRTRESFITKLISRFEVKVNLKSLFKIG